MHFVYILLSELNGKFYIGQTANLDDRLTRHNEGRVPSTKTGRPWKLVYVEQYPSRQEAMVRERELKNWRSPRRIIALIEQSKPG